MASDLVMQVRDDLELAPTLRAREGIDVEHLRYESRPARAAAALLGGLLFNRGLSRFEGGAIAAYAVGIVGVEKGALSPGVRDVIRHSRQPFPRVHRFDVSPESRIVLEPLVDDRLLAVEVDEPLKGQSVSDHIPGHVLEGRPVIRRYRLSEVR